MSETTNMTPILTRLARDIDLALDGTVCQDAIRDASNGGADLSLVEWRFLADMLRAMPEQPDDVQAVIDPVIAGMDRLGRGEEWTEAEARTAVRVAQSEAEARAAAAAVEAWAAVVAVVHVALSVVEEVVEEVVVVAWVQNAAWTATVAGVTRAHQRGILLRLIKEASDADV